MDPFDPAYGAGFEADEAELALSCEFVEDGGAFARQRRKAHDRPDRLAFVDGVMRTEARLTHTDPGGAVSTGLAGCWAVGAVLIAAHAPAAIERVSVGRATIFTGGHLVPLPGQPGGWYWDAYAVPGVDFPAAHNQPLRDTSVVSSPCSKRSARRSAPFATSRRRSSPGVFSSG